MSISGPYNYVDHAGTITSGGSAQEVMAPNSQRKALFVYNESDTDMRVSLGNQTASASVGLLLKAAAYWEPPVPPSGRVTIYCASSSKAFSAGEFS
jgi:hypothetical protein